MFKISAQDSVLLLGSKHKGQCGKKKPTSSLALRSFLRDKQVAGTSKLPVVVAQCN